MGFRYPAAFSAAAVCLFVLNAFAYARAPAIPQDMDHFTAFLSDRFAEAMPGAKVVVKGPLQLEASIEGHSHEIYLSNMWDYCERDRRGCRRQLEAFVTNMSGTMQTANSDVKPSNIRVIVRNASYVASMQHATANSPEKEGIVRPIAGDIWMICAIDMPQGISLLNHETIAKLGLSEDQAIALGLKNVAAALPPLAAETHKLKPMGLTYAAGDFYESSRMLLHDDWTAMSQKMNGHLVVAVPAAEMLIYGNGGGNGDRIVLTSFTKSVVDKAPKPISAMLYQWTPKGWEVVTP